MKRFKKLVSLLLAVVMVLAMSVQGFAASGTSDTQTGSITINSGDDGEAYDIYLMFELESYNSDTDAYSYIITDNWEAFVEEDSVGSEYFEVDEHDYVTLKKSITDSEAADLAKAALAYAIEKGLTPTKTLPTEEGSYTADLGLGYYLVDCSIGALCGLTTTNPTATINEKNTAPELIKEVTNDDKVTATVGDSVNFKVTITAGKGAENYVLKDTLDAGFTFNGDVHITVDKVDATKDDEDLVEDENYYIAAVDSLTNEYTYNIIFTQDFCDTLEAGDKIIVTYSAKLNKDSVVGPTGNKNTVILGYGDNSTTPVAETTTKTWDFDVFKYTGTNTPLSGAKFTVSKNQDGSNPIKIATSSEAINDSTIVYKVSDGTTTATDITEIITDNTGKFTVEGLGAGTYYLKETGAPAGYNKLENAITIVIDVDGNVTADGESGHQVNVLNQTGTILPTTGGIGTTVFYAAGIVLMAGAVFFVVRRKRG